MLDGGPFFEEYPTTPPSFVLNGQIFALWGAYDVGLGARGQQAKADYAAVAEVLAGILNAGIRGIGPSMTSSHTRCPTSPAARITLHITQLKAMQLVDPSPEYAAAIERFERYSHSAFNRARAFALKTAFR